ncbi:MAG TPA: ABC transporter permease, partial [Sphingobium sp.]|nr:ABC transporter permease [Sphingobium sp.]
MAGASSTSGLKAALALIGKRFASSLLTLFLVSAVVFTIAQLLPGDAAQEALGQSTTAEQVAALRREMGLDRPGYERYVSWASSMVGGDPGQSLVANLPVSEVISSRLPNSLLLAALSALVAVPVALAIGIGSAMNRGGKLDRALNISTLSMVAVPEFL